MYRTLLHLVESGSIGKRVQGKQRQQLVVPDEDLAQSPVRFAILEFLSVGQLERGQRDVQKVMMEIGDFSDLKVHVAIRAHEEPLVFEPPLQTNKHRLPGQLL
jgi:hypothetical protein